MRTSRSFPFLSIAAAFVLGLGLSACEPTEESHLLILSGSENEALQPLFEEFQQETGVHLEMKYMGSVDIMLELESGSLEADGVWPANSLWLSLGDKSRRITHAKSIFTSPVVFGVRQAKAQELGWTEKDVAVKDILDAIRSKRLNFMMTSATQSNSGASAYLGFLSALLGNPDVIQPEDLERPQLASQIQQLMGGINRSSGSSGWLKELFLKSPDADAMVNYEAVLIETNQELLRRGEAPLTVIYPVDGLVVADSPLGFNSTKTKDKEDQFLAFQEWLLKPESQKKLLSLGRRTGLGGDITDADKSIFNPEWGIDAEKIISPIRLPSGVVIQKALQLYQTGYRKPSYTIIAVDYSGSMGGSGEEQLEEAMKRLLDQEEAQKYLLQAGAKDKWVIVPFSNELRGEITGEGNSPQALNQLYQQLADQSPDGGTDLYSPLIRGLRIFKDEPDLDHYIPALILMTDGVHNGDTTFAAFQQTYAEAGLDVPVFSILFGEADRTQLEPLAELTRGRVFDGTKDLIKAFRTVKGYN